MIGGKCSRGRGRETDIEIERWGCLRSSIRKGEEKEDERGMGRD